MTLYEAWPGPSRSNRGQPVHVVDWPPGRGSGHALCGRELSQVAVFALGWAPHVGVKRCRACELRLEQRQAGDGAVVIALPVGR